MCTFSFCTSQLSWATAPGESCWNKMRVLKTVWTWRFVARLRRRTTIQTDLLLVWVHVLHCHERPNKEMCHSWKLFAHQGSRITSKMCSGVQIRPVILTRLPVRYCRSGLSLHVFFSLFFHSSCGPFPAQLCHNLWLLVEFGHSEQEHGELNCFSLTLSRVPFSKHSVVWHLCLSVLYGSLPDHDMHARTHAHTHTHLPEGSCYLIHGDKWPVCIFSIQLTLSNSFSLSRSTFASFHSPAHWSCLYHRCVLVYCLRVKRRVSGVLTGGELGPTTMGETEKWTGWGNGWGRQFKEERKGNLSVCEHLSLQGSATAGGACVAYVRACQGATTWWPGLIWTDHLMPERFQPSCFSC